MVHMAHDGNHRWAGFELLRLVLQINFNLFEWRVDLAFAFGAFLDFEPDAVFSANLGRDFLVNGLVHIGEDAHLHQISDDLEWLLLNLIRELADDNRGFDRYNLCAFRQREARGGLGNLGRLGESPGSLTGLESSSRYRAPSAT